MFVLARKDLQEMVSVPPDCGPGHLEHVMQYRVRYSRVWLDSRRK